MLSFPVKRSDLKSAGREQYQGSSMLPNKAKTLARLQPLLVRLVTGRLGRGTAALWMPRGQNRDGSAGRRGSVSARAHVSSSTFPAPTPMDTFRLSQNGGTSPRPDKRRIECGTRRTPLCPAAGDSLADTGSFIPSGLRPGLSWFQPGDRFLCRISRIDAWRGDMCRVISHFTAKS